MYPVLFHLGPLVLPTYGALLAAGLMLALTLSLRTARLAGVSEEKLWNAGLFAVLAAFAASRMLLVAGNWRSFRVAPLLVLVAPSLTAAGLLLALVATLIWLRLQRIPRLRALEAWTSCGLLLWGFIALGHFAEGSDPGMPTTAPWGVRLPGSRLAEQPIALLTAAAAFALAAWTWHSLRLQRPAAGPGLVGAGVAQLLLSFWRLPSAASAAGLDALQWLGVGVTVAGCLCWSAEWRLYWRVRTT